MSPAGRRNALVAAAIVAAAAVAVAVVLAVVGGDDDGGSPRSAEAGTTTSSTSPPDATSTSTVEGERCPAGGPEPHGEIAPQLGDFDGDGRPDDVYLDGTTDGLVVGVRTVAGRSSETRVPSNIVTDVAGTADVDGDAADEVWIVARGNTASGAQVRLATWSGCELVLVRNAEGDPYTFQVNGTDGGVRDGAGVGCVDVDGDGTLDLVGLEFTQRGDEYEWRRTRVGLAGAEARNGAVDSGTYVAGRDDAEIALLSDITCGTRFLAGEKALPRAGDGEGAVP